MALALSDEEKEQIVCELKLTIWEELNHPVDIFDKIIKDDKNSIDYRWKWDDFIILVKEFYGFPLDENFPKKKIELTKEEEDEKYKLLYGINKIND